ncbi:tetratricopeptide repeat protein [Candidatus Thiodiazotropha sp. CDECU1]|uniref:tetratricopeptide repeat protein n=1 Tax=Candidatus Thiodiazotropha sp. CDECU1 TaxID=3065865 RepID=UPI0029308D87|nr:tetratricopeptide repeat protein [Candidatus Thiodiazotropha sp. CDECU1]
MKKYTLTLTLLFIFSLQACNEHDDKHIATKGVEGGFQSQDEGKSFSEANNNLLSKATMLIQEENYSEAINVYRDIIYQSPNEFAAYHGLGTAYYYLDDLVLAKNSYEKAISLNTNLYQAYAGLGAIAKRSKNYSEAIYQFNSAISINKNYALAYYGRAGVYEEINKYEKASNDYNKVVSLAPRSSLSIKAKEKLSAIEKLTSQSTPTQ